MARLNAANALYMGVATALKAMLGATLVWSPLPAGPTIGAFAKGASASGNAASTAAMNMEATGSGIVAGVVTQFYGAGDGIVVSDNKGNTYVLVDSQRESSGTDYLSVYYCADAIGGAGVVITATRSGSGPTVMAAEIKSGSGIELVTNYFTTDDSSPYDCGTVTTSDPANLLIGFIGGHKASGAVTYVPANGETLLLSNTVSQYGAMVAKDAPTPGTYNTSIAVSPTPFTGVGATLAFRKASP